MSGQDETGEMYDRMRAEAPVYPRPDFEDPPHQSYHSLSRFRSVPCWVTEKIDGTNAQILVPPNPAHPVLAGSRTRWVGPRFKTDNFGFGAWVAEHAEVLRRLGPGQHYGEWWGEGIQRRYGLTEKRLSLFNTQRFEKSGLPEGLPANVGLVPVLYQGPFDTRKIDEVIAKLYREGSVAAPGWRGAGKAGPEGVVVKVGGCTPWKLTDNGDVKKGRAHHVEAAVGAVNVDRDYCYDGGPAWTRVIGFDIAGCPVTELIDEDSDDATVRSAMFRVADRVVTADAAILDARKAAQP